MALPYDPKVTGLIENVRYPLDALWTPGTKSSAARTAALVDDAWVRRDELSAGLTVAAAEQRTAAERNFEILETLGRAG